MFSLMVAPVEILARFVLARLGLSGLMGSVGDYQDEL
jgi:hypothetical protein